MKVAERRPFLEVLRIKSEKSVKSVLHPEISEKSGTARKALLQAAC